MATVIRVEKFKEIISGQRTPTELGLSGSVSLNVVENKMEVGGDFELNGDLIFDKGEQLDHDIIFDGGTYKNIIFLGGYFQKLFFRRGEYKGYVSIRGGIIQNLILLGGNFDHWVGTLDGEMNEHADGKPLANEPLKIGRFEIEGGYYRNNIWISGGDIDRLDVKSVTPITLHCKPNDDQYYDDQTKEYKFNYKSKPRIENLVISRYSDSGSYYQFSDIDLTSLSFESFTNLGNITITKVNLKGDLEIQNSDLGETTFIDCDFTERNLKFESSKINEIALAGSKLPNPSRIIGVESDDKVQKRLALSQIKKVYQNLGDNLEARSYQAEELNTYMSTLNFGWEKMNLWLNKFSNNHGQRWDRPLALLMINSLVFYSIFCLLLGFEIDFTSKTGYDVFSRNLSFYFEFLNPIRKSDFLPKALLGIDRLNEVPHVAILIDSIARILNSYFLYQFIAAFRKFGRLGK